MRNSARILVVLGILLLSFPARAFDPITTVVGKGVSVAMDVRTGEEIKLDTEIDAAITKKLLDQKGKDFSDVSVLVFARDAVLVGFAKNAEVKRRAEALARHDKLKSLKDAIIVGKAEGNFAHNAFIDEKISLSLTAAKGVSSVNMRWKVYGSDVFIMGIAQSGKEVSLALKTIKGVKGVKKIHSSLSVRKVKKK